MQFISSHERMTSITHWRLCHSWVMGRFFSGENKFYCAIVYSCVFFFSLCKFKKWGNVILCSEHNAKRKKKILLQWCCFKLNVLIKICYISLIHSMTIFLIKCWTYFQDIATVNKFLNQSPCIYDTGWIFEFNQSFCYAEGYLLQYQHSIMKPLF